MQEILAKLKLDTVNTLVIVNELDENLILASRNIPNILLIDASEINVLDLVAANKVLVTKDALKRLKVDEYGLDSLDIEYLNTLINKFNGGPVGIDTMASAMGEEISSLEDVIEPYLMQEGFIKRTQRGRVATDKAYKHVGGIHEETLF